MVGKYLTNLSKSILMSFSGGLSKVRFAKIIYFVHKKLISGGLVLSNELEFIRMPLGPVPVGFMELGAVQGIKIAKSQVPSLSYDMEIYSLSETTDGMGTVINGVVSDCVVELNKLSTSELVEASHRDQSWKISPNGTHFIIQDEDLFNGQPLSKNIIKVSDEQDDQMLQAKLVEGMMSEIVEETTNLEYPQEDS